jgi:hypothetical protein
MLTGVAVTPHVVSLGRVGFRPTPYDWVPLAVIILIIVLIFVRVYVVGDWFRRRKAHRAGHVPGRGAEHGHPAGDHGRQAVNHGHSTRKHGHHSEPKRQSHRR